MRFVPNFIFWLFSLFLLGQNMLAQDRISLDSIPGGPLIDSLFIDHDLANYSARLFVNHKSQRFSFKDGSDPLTYIPNNQNGVGFGFASNKLLIDIAFNIKPKGEEPTERFNFSVSFKLRNHYFDLYYQRYKGFNVEHEQLGHLGFRKDIIAKNGGINYLYLFNEDSYHLGTLRSVISHRAERDFSIGLGGFLFGTGQKGDEPLALPDDLDDPDFPGINRTSGFGVGVLGGLGAYFPLFGDFYSSVSMNAGIGLMTKDIEDANGNELDTNPMLYQLSAKAILGFVRDRYYLNLLLDTAFFQTEIFDDVNELLAVSQAKIAVGYKFL